MLKVKDVNDSSLCCSSTENLFLAESRSLISPTSSTDASRELLLKNHKQYHSGYDLHHPLLTENAASDIFLPSCRSTYLSEECNNPESQIEVIYSPETEFCFTKSIETSKVKDRFLESTNRMLENSSLQKFDNDDTTTTEMELIQSHGKINFALFRVVILYSHLSRKGVKK